jgi:hypothetical protein
MRRTTDRTSDIRLSTFLLVFAVYSIGCATRKAPITQDPAFGGSVELTGVVKDSITPVANVRVTLRQGGSLRAQTTTRKDGSFAFGAQPPGDYKFSASRDGYAPCAFDMTLLWPEQSVVTGIVPAADTARLRQRKELFRYGTTCSCRIVRPNNFTRVVSKDTNELPARSSSPSTAEVVVMAVDADEGNAIMRAVVRLVAESPAGGATFVNQTNDRGVVIFSNVPPGVYRVRTMRLGFVFFEDHVTARAGSTDSLTVRMRWGDNLCFMVHTGR